MNDYYHYVCLNTFIWRCFFLNNLTINQVNQSLLYNYIVVLVSYQYSRFRVK